MQTSIIICNYNNSKYLGRAIRSCLKQTEPAEIIVVDDCSTDNSQEVLYSFGDKIKRVMLSENMGVANASNEGIKAASGEYVMRVDADDYINEHMVSIFSQVLEWNKNIGFVYGDLLIVDETEKITGRKDINTLDLLLRYGAGIIFRKSYLEAIGLYDKKLRNAEDYDLIKRYFKNWDGFHLPLPLYRHRRHASNMTNDVGARKEWEKISDEKRTQK